MKEGAEKAKARAKEDTAKVKAAAKETAAVAADKAKQTGGHDLAGRRAAQGRARRGSLGF